MNYTRGLLFSGLLLVVITAFSLFFPLQRVFASSILTAAGPGGGPHVRSFTPAGVAESDPDKLMAYADNYRGGVRVATGDIDSDGVDEIITGTG